VAATVAAAAAAAATAAGLRMGRPRRQPPFGGLRNCCYRRWHQFHAAATADVAAVSAAAAAANARRHAHSLRPWRHGYRCARLGPQAALQTLLPPRLSTRDVAVSAARAVATKNKRKRTAGLLGRAVACCFVRPRPPPHRPSPSPPPVSPQHRRPSVCSDCWEQRQRWWRRTLGTQRRRRRRHGKAPRRRETLRRLRPGLRWHATLRPARWRRRHPRRRRPLWRRPRQRHRRRWRLL